MLNDNLSGKATDASMQPARAVPGQATGEAFWQGSRSRRFLTQVFEENLLLFAGQELVIAGDRVEQDLRVAIVQVCSSQEVGTDHLQTVAARFVRAQHQGYRLDRPGRPPRAGRDANRPQQ